jgi:uncharacterized protein YecE (DUF72 family)
VRFGVGIGIAPLSDRLRPSGGHHGSPVRPPAHWDFGVPVRPLGGVFYPRSLARRDWFEHYARTFDTVEINNTFYRLPEAETVASWRERAPPGFVYAVKFSRYGTHMKHLEDPHDTVGKFLERMRRLEHTLGPVLVQIPPNWNADPERLEAFLATTPRHLRWTVEVRDARWLTEDVYRVLRDAGAALCVHDLLDEHPWERTAEWTYLRYHGDRYGGRYTHQKADAERIAAEIGEGRDVFVYFNNDLDGHAVTNAQELGRYVRRRVEGEG